MRNGNFWTVEFVTGEYGNRYRTRKEAEEYARACNSYSERVAGERVVRAVVEYRGWEERRRVAV